MTRDGMDRWSNGLNFLRYVDGEVKGSFFCGGITGEMRLDNFG